MLPAHAAAQSSLDAYFKSATPDSDSCERCMRHYTGTAVCGKANWHTGIPPVYISELMLISELTLGDQVVH